MNLSFAVMAVNHLLHIVRFGLIGETSDGDQYRHIVFRDTVNGREADYLITKKKHNAIWKGIEDLEQGKTIPPYKGYISKFNGIEVVVLGDESLEEAFSKQRWKLDIHRKISRFEADRLRWETKGYITNLTNPGAMEVSWYNIHPDSKMIRFRYYEGNGTFSWSKWYEIED